MYVQITKYQFSKQVISWNEPFDLTYTVKMGSSQAISASYDGYVEPSFTPNNYTDIRNDDPDVNWARNLRLSGVEITPSGYDDGSVNATISKGSSKAFTATGGYLDPDMIAIPGTDGDYGLTQLELMLKRSGDNGASRAYPLGLWITAADNYGDGRQYGAHVENAVTFLLEREIPEITDTTITDDRIGATGESALERFGAFVQGESIPRLQFGYQLDPLAPGLTASFSLYLYSSDGALFQTHAEEDGVVTVRDTDGNVLRTYNAEPGTFVLDPPAVSGRYTWHCGIIDSAGSQGETDGYFDVLPYTRPSISLLEVERYNTGVDDEGTPVYTAADDGLHVRFNLTANAASVAGKNACTITANYGADDLQSRTRTLFTEDDGITINLTEDRSLITDDISPAYPWSFTFVIADFFGEDFQTVYVDKAGADFNAEAFGVSVGMRSTGQMASKKFEVAPKYKSIFYGGIAGVTDFATDETPTYGTWIDGMPIYRKVVEFGAVAKGETVSTSIGIDVTNLGVPISTAAMGLDSDGITWRPISFANKASLAQTISAMIDNWTTEPTLTIIAGGSTTGVAGGGFAIIEYTRIVDTPEEDEVTAALLDENNNVLYDSSQVALLAADHPLSTYTLMYSGPEIDEGIAAGNSALSMAKTMSAALNALTEEVAGIDRSPGYRYEATYDSDYMYTLWQIEGEGTSETRTAVSRFKIVGGSGGASTSQLKIEYVTGTPLVVTVNDKAEITYRFSGTDSSGDAVQEGVGTWTVAGRVVKTETVLAGENTFDATEYLTIGTQKVVLSVTDDNGSTVTKTWNVQKIDVRLESGFDDTLAYPMGAVTFDYTPYGAISKDVHINLGGEEIAKINTGVSGIPMSYELPARAHGSHLLEMYMTATVNGNDIESNRIKKDILWYDPATNIPVIGCAFQNFTARQHDTTNIVYTVHDPRTETPTVEIAVDGTVVSTQTLVSATNTYPFKTDAAGTHTITITCGETVKTLTANITKLDINVTPVTAGLVFDFNPVGHSNSDANRLWSDGDIAMSVSDNFDWVNGGYHFDDAGDQYFCIKAGTSADISYHLFADDAKKNGKEMKMIFRTTNVQDPDAKFLSCVDNTTASNHIGIEMYAHEAKIYAQAGHLTLPYSEEDIIEFEFNISKSTESIPMIMGYEDGVSTSPMVYDASHNFTQSTPKVIRLGSDKCDLHIYRMKAYNASLPARGILSNFIADARTAEEMIARYDRNQIYDENSQLTAETLAEKCPHLRIIKIDAPYFTNNKSDKVPGTIVECIYKNGDAALDNWTAYNCQHSGQGTSSNNYGAAGRNLDLIMNKSGIDGVEPYIILGDGTQVSKVSLTRTSVPVNYFNVKVNIASSENANNSLLQRRYNEFNPYSRPFVRGDGTNVDYIKDTMEFYNCVVFIRENDADTSTHREFADTDWHFYALGNIGDSKKTDKTRLNDPYDPYECIVEIMDVEYPNSDFSGTPEAIAALEADNFDEKGTYGWRYIYEDGTDEQNAAAAAYCKARWVEFYKFVVNSTDEEFKAGLGDYFVLDSALYYYLFTTRYTMVDNRAKNSFWHYAKTGETDSDGNPIRKWDLCFDYDNDTALGINNYGDMVYRYGYEDTDVDENGEEIFRESDSTFFCRLRDLFADELKALYNTLESRNAWHGDGLINQFDAWQDQFPEELWRVDIERKYIRTYNSSFINGPGDAQFLNNMAHGKKKYQRRQYERNQEKYMASKYQSSVASADNAVLRCTVPTGDLAVQPNYRLKITPYAYMYLNVKYGTQPPIQLRAEPNVEYEIPFEGSGADIIDIYSASMLQSLGDLSACYPATVDISRASRITQLIIGNGTAGYENPSLNTLTLGANYLLEVLNVENASGLTQSLDLSALQNLKQLYAKGSGVGGVTFANGGLIEKAYLPEISTLTMRNLAYLTTLDIASYDLLTTITVEYCQTLDLLALLEAAANIDRLRMLGIDWSLPDITLLERIYAMNGIDKNGYNADQSVLAGKVHSAIMKQRPLELYSAAWPDLEISYDSLVAQYPVYFKNWDGTLLNTQYIDRNSDAVEPISAGLISTPTRESSVSTVYTYTGWDKALTNIVAERTITAVYSESVRQYTLRWHGYPETVILETQTVDYASEAVYSGEIPTRTNEESLAIYYQFVDWDKSTGFTDQDLEIYPVWERGELPEAGVDTETLNPTQIYAIKRSGNVRDYFDYKDRVNVALGYKPEYTNVQHVDLADELVMDGATAIDTGVKLLENGIADAWTLVADVTFDTTTDSQCAVCCMQEDGEMGFRLRYYDGGPNVLWGTNSISTRSTTYRELLVLRHEAGNRNLKVYASRTGEMAISTAELTRLIDSITDAPLVLGAQRSDDGTYSNYATGTLHSCRIYYADLGDTVCRKIACWPGETYKAEAGTFGAYALAEDSTQNTKIDFIFASLLSRTYKAAYESQIYNDFAESARYAWMVARLLPAFPVVWQQMIEECLVNTSIYEADTQYADALRAIPGNRMKIWCPSYYELTGDSTTGAYAEEGAEFIPYFVNNEARDKWLGPDMLPRDGYATFTSATDPALNSADDVQEGDIWINSSENNTGYLRKNGTWIKAARWYIRSASNYNNNHFAFVSEYGTAHVGGHGRSNLYGVPVRFAI